MAGIIPYDDYKTGQKCFSPIGARIGPYDFNKVRDAAIPSDVAVANPRFFETPVKEKFPWQQQQN
jgi:hypothetical protein